MIRPITRVPRYETRVSGCGSLLHPVRSGTRGDHQSRVAERASTPVLLGMLTDSPNLENWRCKEGFTFFPLSYGSELRSN